MLKRIMRSLVVLGTAGTLALALGGVASADVPAIFVGSSPIGSVGDCIGVILDQDGHYNRMDASGNGYDALLCAPSDTRSAFGWGHAGGYYINSGGNQICVREDGFIGGAWKTLRTICTIQGQVGSTMRFLDSTSLYRLTRTH